MIRGGIFWIASYPKSGNTWIRCLLASLLSDGAPPDLAQLGRFCRNGADRALIESVVGEETGRMSAAQLIEARGAAYRHLAADGLGRRCLKVHDRWLAALFPLEATVGCVHIVRDPRDVVVSLAAHLAIPVDAAIDFMSRRDSVLFGAPDGADNQAPQLLGSWSEHVAGWRALSDRPLLSLRYEDMLADPHAAAVRLAAFLELKASAELIARAVAACGFENLKAFEDERGFVEKPAKMQRFFREGRSGGWRNVLTASQSDRVVELHGAAMRGLGYGVERDA